MRKGSDDTPISQGGNEQNVWGGHSQFYGEAFQTSSVRVVNWSIFSLLSSFYQDHWETIREVLLSSSLYLCFIVRRQD